MSINLPSQALSTYYSFIKNATNLNIKFSEPKKPVQTSIFYINDAHGAKIDRYKTAADTFEKQYKSDSKDTFKLSAGDINIGKNKNRNDFIIESLNLMGIDLSTIGNHETDMGISNLAQTLGKSTFRFVDTNMDIQQNSELYPKLKEEKLVKSWIINKNGHNYGFIGASPSDLVERATGPEWLKGIKVENTENTIKDLQEEVEKLNKLGINKVIFLSHLGYNKDLQVAKSISGIDVIIGGHSHDIIDGINPERNSIVSPAGEPVIITQGGKDGEYFGILNVIFDSEGKVIAAGNKLNKISEWPKDKSLEKLKEKYLGSSLPIGKLSNKCYPVNPRTEENPIGNLITDSIRHKSKAQIALMHSSNQRGGLDTGVVDASDIYDILPFNDKVHVINLSEKELVDALQLGINSTTHQYVAGLLQVSGLKYTISSDKKLKDIYLENKDGSFTKINNINPATDKQFTVAIPSFILGGGEGYTMLKKIPVKTFEWTDADATVDYIKSLNNKPLILKQDGRITVENLSYN